jgi:cytochrome c-type biogenesis protein CcmH
MTRLLAVVIVASLAMGCRAAPSPAPEAPRAVPASPDGLRPLTSRDAAVDPAPPAGAFGGTASAGAGAASVAPAPHGPGVSGTVAIAPSLAGRIQPTDVLYLIARSAKTGGVVAVRREDGVRFPFHFALDAADVMVQGTPFEGPFDVTARLSKTGDAVPAKGDLEGSAGGVAIGSLRVAITLDRVRQ